MRPPRPRLRPAGPGGLTGGDTAERPPKRGGAGAKSGRRGRRGPSPEGARRPAPRDGACGLAAGSSRPLGCAGAGTQVLHRSLLPGPQRRRRGERGSAAILRAPARLRWPAGLTAAHGDLRGPAGVMAEAGEGRRPWHRSLSF